jgi:uncharacterized protein YggU (UPF0235/DUF167 family)
VSGGTPLLVKLEPRISKNEIGEPLGDELKIKVTTPPVDAAANWRRTCPPYINGVDEVLHWN